jgi:hypothetical protein
LFSRVSLAAALAALIIASLLALVPAGVPGRVAAYILLMGVPGVALYLLLERRPEPLEAAAAGVVLSPVLAAVSCTLIMVAGGSPATAARWTIALSGTSGAAALWVLGRRERGGREASLGAAQWAILGACVLATLVLVGVLPLTSEWWRFRSDAWFHRAVIAQISDRGLPPDDPYFAGFTLQYMWLYHVLVLALSRATSLGPFWVMPLVNLQSLAGVLLATMLFSGIFTRRFGRRLGSCLTVTFGLNGLFWLFLPLKAVRVLVGSVRGTEELARTFSLSPFDMVQVRRFLIIYFNQDFLLDKFIVATAFGLAFGCMALFWWATTEYLRDQRRFPLVAAGLSLMGMLGFHTLFGFIMLVAAGGGMALSFLFRRRIDGYRLPPALELSLGLAAALALSSPYLYSIMHLKQSEHVLPLNLSLKKIAGIVISCAAVFVLAAFQRSFFAGRDMWRRYVQFAVLSTAVFCALIVLPGANTYDKLPFFLFYPLAVIGGWTVADVVARRHSTPGRIGAALVVALLVLVPVNAISFAAYFNTPTVEMYTRDEAATADWVRKHTAPEAVFIDEDKEDFLVVAGPRRYYCGKLSYARQWQYDRLQIARRIHARDVLLGDGPLDLSTLRLLSEAPWPLYVIDRSAPGSAATVSRHPELFARVFASGGITLYRVNRDACARAARRFREEGKEEVPAEQLIRESGL